MIICLLLALAFLGAGVPKILRVQQMRDEIVRWRLPPSFLPVIGVIEVAGAALLLAGVVADDAGIALAGAVVLLCVAIGAVATHVRIGDPPARTAPPAVLGVLAAVAVALLA